MHPDDREALEVQNAELAKLGKGVQFLYSKFVNPVMKALSEDTPAKMLFGPWMNYFIYAIAIAYIAFTGFYLVMFGIYIGSDLANEWLQSIIFTIVLGLLLSEPCVILCKAVMLPALANFLVMKQALKRGVEVPHEAVMKKAREQRAAVMRGKGDLLKKVG